MNIKYKIYLSIVQSSLDFVFSLIWQVHWTLCNKHLVLWMAWQPPPLAQTRSQTAPTYLCIFIIIVHWAGWNIKIKQTKDAHESAKNSVLMVTVQIPNRLLHDQFFPQKVGIICWSYFVYRWWPILVAFFSVSLFFQKIHSLLFTLVSL